MVFLSERDSAPIIAREDHLAVCREVEGTRMREKRRIRALIGAVAEFLGTHHVTEGDLA